MLSTIIPDLDCCSSFKIFNRKFIHLYPSAGIEVSIHKSLQFQQSHRQHLHFLHQQQTPPSRPPPPPATLSSLIPHQLPPSPGHEHGNVDVDGEGDEVAGDDEGEPTLWQKYFRFLAFSKDKKSPPNQIEEASLKLNQTVRIDVQNQAGELVIGSDDQQNDFEHISSLTSTTETPTAFTKTTTTTVTTTTTESQEDVQFKLISEIVTLECVDILKWEFCLNGGRCFLYPILNHSLSSCECAEGFVGERCEAKSYEFIPRIRPRIALARFKGGPLVYGLAFVDVLFLIFLFCKNYNRD